MKKKLTMFLSLFFIGIGFLTAQTQVRGTVVDEEGEPAVGATIQIKGTLQGTVTDMNGNFSLSAPTDGTLVISYVGFVTQEVNVSPTVRVVLQSGTRALDEVVVVAYGTVTREAKTGAVSSVSGANISDAPVVSMDKALGGKIAGVSITAIQDNRERPLPSVFVVPPPLTRGTTPYGWWMAFPSYRSTTVIL